MPVLLFTTDEVTSTLILRQRGLSTEIRELADLAKKPLAPGESVDSRYHKIARLGVQLADAFDAFDTIMRATGTEGDDEADKPAPATPAAPNQSQTN